MTHSRNLRSRRRRPVAQMNDIMLTPLIDTALTLLIIFIVTTPMINNQIAIDLPEGKTHQAADAQQEVVVFVDKNGNYYCNDVELKNIDALIAHIQRKITNKKSTVFVKADRAVSYGQVITVVDALIVGGVQHVAMATKRVA
jgi:biopolymer transport protein ExbD